MMASSTSVSVNSSVFVGLLSKISSTATITTLANYSSLLLSMEDFIFSTGDELLPLLPLRTTDALQFPSSFYYYVGSLGEPPCTRQVPHLVTQDLVIIPASFIELINISSRGVIWNSDGVLLQPVLNTTLIYQGSLYQLNLETNISTLLIPSEMQKVIREGGMSLSEWRWATESVLIAVNMLLFGLFLILCLTRKERLRRSFPLGLGGLNHRVMWDLHSYEKAAEIAKWYDEEKQQDDENDEGGGEGAGVEGRRGSTLHGQAEWKKASHVGQQPEKKEEIAALETNFEDYGFF